MPKKLPAVAAEEPKVAERRISTMTESQIMERLRAVVSQDDPAVLYAKIKKVGQGFVASFPRVPLFPRSLRPQL